MGMENLLLESSFVAMISTILTFISVIIGIYIFLLGLWELRVATSRENYTNYMFYSILFILILPIAITIFVNRILLM